MGNVPPLALREPPPPGRCLLIDSDKVPSSTTSKADGDRSRVRSRPFYSRMRRNIESLPDELLMEILLRLSADDIYDNARLVCRRLFHLIHTEAFVREHLHGTSSGLLLMIKLVSDLHIPVLVTSTTQGQVETSQLTCRIDFPIMCSCNGLALCLRENTPRVGGYTPFIFNPATKCAFNLPMFDVGKAFYPLGMAYAAASMAYKVVGSYRKSGIRHSCVILTVGVDKTWRDVAPEGLSLEDRRLILGHFNIPFITGCFVHWVSGIRVVSLNVETETFTVTRIPALMFASKYQYRYCCLSTGEYLSMFIPCGIWSWEVWEMKPETWEWRKILPNIDLEAHKCKILQFASKKDDVLEPVGWVRYPDLLAFLFVGAGRSCIVYNLDREEINSVELPITARQRCVVQHRNSFVWLEKR